MINKALFTVGILLCLFAPMIIYTIITNAKLEAVKKEVFKAIDEHKRKSTNK